MHLLGIAMLIASVIIMSRVADAEDRSSIIWGVITLVLCLACDILIPLPLISIGIGLVVSFLSMFALNVIND